MALSNATVWEVRPTVGSDTNGGGYVSGGTDYSQQDSPQLSVTDLACTTGSTTITSTTGGFTAAMVGNLINISSGTNFSFGFYQITSFTNGNTVVVDRTPAPSGNGSGGTAKVGGALATLGSIISAVGAFLGGNTAWVKATGNHTVTTTISVTVAGSTTLGRTTVRGYGTTRGDGTRATVTCATNSVALFTLNAANFFLLKDLNLTHTAATRGDGVTTVTAVSTDVRFENLAIDGCAVGLNGTTRFTGFAATGCEIKNCTSHGIQADGGGEVCVVSGCYIHDNAASGVTCSNTSKYVLLSNVIESNGGRGFYDSATTRTQLHQFYGNTFYNNTNSGIEIAATTGSATIGLVNNVFASNGAFGVKVDDGTTETDARFLLQRKNAFYSNTSGQRSGSSAAPDDITLSADPFTNAAAGDFSLNNTAGGGASLRAAAFPGAFPGGTTTSYGDVGAAQHQDAGGSTTYIVVTRRPLCVRRPAFVRRVQPVIVGAAPPPSIVNVIAQRRVVQTRPRPFVRSSRPVFAPPPVVNVNQTVVLAPPARRQVTRVVQQRLMRPLIAPAPVVVRPVLVTPPRKVFPRPILRPVYRRSVINAPPPTVVQQNVLVAVQRKVM